MTRGAPAAAAPELDYPRLLTKLPDPPLMRNTQKSRRSVPKRPLYRAAIRLVLAATFCGCGGGGGGGSASGPVQAVAVYSSPAFLTGLAITPGGDILFNELETGAVRIIPSGDSMPLPAPVIALPVPPRGTAQGLLGIAVDPDYDSTGWVYVYETAPNPTRNRVVRFRLVEKKGVDSTVLIDNIPAGGHDGGKLGFDEERHLLVTTGDAGDPAISQDPAPLGGKVLRLNRDGTIPSDNPIPGSPVYALGFRNVFGIARHPASGTLYVSENGPSCDDEVDRLVPGGNYGWRPAQPCGEENPAFISPIHRITPSAGATGVVFHQGGEFSELNGQLLVAGYNAGEIRALEIDDSANGGVVSESVLYPGGAGSIIDLAESPSGEILFTTSGGIFRLTHARP